MTTYTIMYRTITRVYTLGALSSALSYMGLVTSTSYRVLADSPEYVIAAALARMSTGA